MGGNPGINIEVYVTVFDPILYPSKNGNKADMTNSNRTEMHVRKRELYAKKEEETRQVPNSFYNKLGLIGVNFLIYLIHFQVTLVHSLGEPPRIQEPCGICHLSKILLFQHHSLEDQASSTLGDKPYLVQGKL